MKILYSKSLAISLLCLISFIANSQNQQKADSIDLFLKEKMEKLHIPEMKESNGFGWSPSLRKLRKVLIKQNYNNALKLAENLKKNDSVFVLSENELNDYGYKLLAENNQTEALKVFKLNVDLYSQSTNAYDSYAETLAALGNNKEAIKNYKKAFQLNPKNLNAQEQIKKLENL